MLYEAKRLLLSKSRSNCGRPPWIAAGIVFAGRMRDSGEAGWLFNPENLLNFTTRSHGVCRRVRDIAHRGPPLLSEAATTAPRHITLCAARASGPRVAQHA